MRTTKKLLEILYDNYETHPISNSMCMQCIRMQITNKITFDENQRLKEYIEKHKPFFSKFRKDAYYWNPRKRKPRIRWLKKHIKKLSK